MAEKGSSFNKFLVLVILAGGAYVYYDKKLKPPEPITNDAPIAVADDDRDAPVKTEPYFKFLDSGDFKSLAKALEAKENKTDDEKKLLGVSYKESGEIDKANQIFEQLYNAPNVSRSVQADARIEQVLMYIQKEDFKTGMEFFTTFIKELDPDQLPILELTLGDLLWKSFGDKINHYWYEMHYAYALAYNGLTELHPRFKEIEERLNKLNRYIFFSKSYVNNMEYYTVASGDNLERIAKEYNINKESIQLSNEMKGLDVIRAGQQLKIIKGVATIKAKKDAYEMVLYLNGRYLKRYKIGLGKQNKTPLGLFKIGGNSKQTRPGWYDRTTGANYEYVDGGTNGNPLGTHWIPFADGSGYGIHGTWDRESIGFDRSNGCIRMLNEEVEEVYAFLDSRSTVLIE